MDLPGVAGVAGINAILGGGAGGLVLGGIIEVCAGVSTPPGVAA